MSGASFRVRTWLALCALGLAGLAAGVLAGGAGELKPLALLAFAVLLAGAALAGALALARPVESLATRARGLGRGAAPGAGSSELAEIGLALEETAEEVRANAELIASARSRTASLLGGMAEGVVAVDPQGRVLLMNQSAADILGLERGLPEGTPLWSVLRFPELERALRVSLDGDPQDPIDAHSPRGGGRMLSLSVHAVRAETGLQGAVALLSDVTAVRKLEQMRIDFVANVSHELRTPLSAVLGALETISDPQTDDATARRFLELAQRNAVRLQAIVSDLLELSAIETQGADMPVEPLPLGSPLRAAIAALAGAAETKGVALVLEPLPAGPLRIEGNHERLERVFTNLVENAIKYTPPGGHVRARVRAEPGWIAIEVQDDGVGIPAAHLPRVFERFYRVDRSRSREMGGTGLGLAIVKHIVRAHGGNVEVESEEGRGALFRVRLPALESDPAAA